VAFLESKQPVEELCPKFVGEHEPRYLSLGKTALTVLPCDIFTDLYAAAATLWKVEVTASNV